MASPITLYHTLHQGIFERLKYLDGVPPLLFRSFLAPVMIAAGLHKIVNFEDMVSWFGNPDWGLGLPAPALMVFLAAAAEFAGGLLLLIGLAVRWVTIPLMVSMLVAAFAGSDPVLDAYHHAVAQRYRFFSYGDAMLILPPPK